MAWAVSETAPSGAALFAAGAVATIRAALFTARFFFAQRAFCAAAIFARASTLTTRFAIGLAGDFAGMKLVPLSDKFARDGRPGSRLIVISGLARSTFASSRREICASISIIISFVFMDTLPLRLTYETVHCRIVMMIDETIGSRHDEVCELCGRHRADIVESTRADSSVT